MKENSATYARLVKAGISLARKKGLEGFNIRELCAKSGANLGVFHYYFKSRENFNNIIFNTLYSDIAGKIRLDISLQHSPRENFAYILKHLSSFAEENKTLLASLIKDLINGNKKVRKAVAQNVSQTVNMIFRGLDRSKKLGILIDGDKSNLFFMAVLPVIAPHILAGFAGKSGFAGFNGFENIKTEEAIELALNSIFK
ncbi:MAG: TetR family transcriptional regulator [Endomicrobia bacterium]|nr:TetR family transcriptional regulator [Endomicrobiia bacterium]